MAKRSVSKNFQSMSDPDDIMNWVFNNLPLIVPNAVERLEKKICITINLDPDKKATLIPEGPKIPKEYHKNRR